MPPWLPKPGHGDFINARRLSNDQIDLIDRWARAGAPEGDARDLPAPPSSLTGWQLGAPDLVIEMPVRYTLDPQSHDVFRNFVLPVPVVGTRFVRGVEFRFSNYKAVHHAVLLVDTLRSSRRLDEQDAAPGFDGMISEAAQSPFGHFVGWTPGNMPKLGAAEMAWTLEPGTDLVLQLHMMPSEKQQQVGASVALYFSDVAPTQTPILLKLTSKTLDIPPGEANYRVTDSYLLPADVDVLAAYPHAHFLGRELRGFARLPDGSLTPLLWIEEWNFLWQDVYRYRVPVFLPKGTTITMEYRYDNSRANPHAGHAADRQVVYGPGSFDEMADLWLQVLPRDRRTIGLLAQQQVERERRADIAGAEQSLARHPNDLTRRLLLGTLYFQAGRLAEAVRENEKALAIEGASAEAHNNLAAAFEAQGRLPEAIGHYREAARLQPQDGRIALNLGNTLQAAGRSGEALTVLGRAVALNPESTEAHNNYGVALASGRRLPEAIAQFRAALALNKGDADAHCNLGMALASRGDVPGGIGHVREALALNPQHPNAHANLEILLRLQGGGRQ